ncbi:MAG TPA: GspE/PulE family protein [Candidatus Baltobacteraceae bacterium]|jgi:type IV pilus assembly protein PilB|nr:GspE/PulE family protein [Candidatus Baltobacteraceae bacterium]
MPIDVSAYDLEADAIRRIPRALAIRHDVLSLESDGNQITIAVPDLDDRDTIDRIRLATGMHVRALYAPREEIRARLFDAYRDEAAILPAVRRNHNDEAPAVRTLEQLHRTSVDANASDIHIEPSKHGGRVRHRVDGILNEILTLPPELHSHVVSRVKLLAGMDIADKRQPQDGRYVINVHGRSIDGRVSSMPTTAGEKLVIRLLDHAAQIPTLDELGMPQSMLRRFRPILRGPHGFVIVCGPTGSGKTTTLYAALSERDVSTENLCTVEDPVEVTVPGIAQVQINPRAGVTFATTVRAFLRQDPNVIMIGEMRDEETAGVAGAAALSGQLVLTSLHSNDAPTAIDRLLELGVPRQTIAAGLTAVIAQRLVRKLCMNCREPFLAGMEFLQEFGIQQRAGAYRARGCRDCNGSGYAGRVALFESLFVDADIRAAIAQGSTGVGIAALSRAKDYEPILTAGVEAVTAGRTSFEELRRVLVVSSGR